MWYNSPTDGSHLIAQILSCCYLIHKKEVGCMKCYQLTQDLEDNIATNKETTMILISNPMLVLDFITRETGIMQLREGSRLLGKKVKLFCEAKA